MKKTTLTIGLALMGLLATKTVQAQKGAQIGFMYMPQSSWLVNETDNNTTTLERDATTGTALGVSLVNNFTDIVGIEIDLLLSTQGQKYTNGGFSASREFQYIKVPFLLSINTDATKTFMFVGKIGPQVSFLNTAEHSGSFEPITVTGDAKDYYKATTWSAVLGLGLGINLGKSLIATAGVRLDYSLADIENKDNSYWNTNWSNRSSTYQGLAGLEFGLRIKL